MDELVNTKGEFDEINEEEYEYVVRRLTCRECERLQGFPDDWTLIAPWVDSKGKVHKEADSPRFKALGNSIATGPNSYWEFILKRISEKYDYKPTMASLFDGIGGFPLLWDGINGEGKTLWASEIEEFPIAVTKIHFPKMEHLGDITKIDGHKVPIVDCVIGGSPCFPAGTLIYTNNGLKNIEDIRIGDMVLTHTGNFQKVLRVGGKISTTILLKNEMFKLECTPNHPIYSYNEENGGYEWIPAENMLNRLCAIVSKEPYDIINKNNGYVVKKDELHYWYRVNEISELNKEKHVFNLEVENDNSYVANGIVVHNCQDLSVAGKRAGLDGERSGLFMEQIRIIKELREQDESIGRTNEFCRPRFGVWENVTGALSSNNGDDFRAVLEEFCKVAGCNITIPRPNDKGKWTKNGCIMGDKFSVAWTVHNAKDWCVPQRRERISVVADFGGKSAPEILFECQSLSGDSEQSREERKETARDSQESSGEYH